MSLPDFLDVVSVLTPGVDFVVVDEGGEFCVVCYTPPLSTRSGFGDHAFQNYKKKNNGGLNETESIEHDVAWLNAR